MIKQKFIKCLQIEKIKIVKRKYLSSEGNEDLKQNNE